MHTPTRPWYVIMDARALTDIDAAIILSADGDRPPLRRVQKERNTNWPGCPIVDIVSNQVVAELRRDTR